MAEFDDLKKSIDELRKIEAERLKMEKKEFEETAEDRVSRLDKKAFGDLVQEFRKNNSIEKDARKLTDKRFEALEKGALAKITKSSAKNTELTAAQHNLTKEMRVQAFAEATELEKAKRVDSSVLVSTGRILSTIASNFLENTQVGQAILGQAIDETSLTRDVVAAIITNGLESKGAFKTELSKLGKQLGGKLEGVKKGLGKVRDFSKTSLRFFTDPSMFIKTITGWFWKLVIKPAFSFLFKSLGFLLKLPFKAFDKLSGLFRGKGGSTFALKRTEEKREKDREGKQRKTLIERLTGLRGGISKLAKAMRLGTSAGGLGKIVTAIGAILLIAVPFMISAVKEFIKTGDFQKAIGEGFVGIARVLTLGLFDPERLRELIKAPFLDMISGIKSLIAGQFTAEAFLKTLGGAGKFAAAPFEIAFDLGTKIVSGVAWLLGFDNFRAELKAAFADFNLFDSIVDSITFVIDSMVGFFTGTANEAAVGIAGLDSNVAAAKIAKMTEKTALDDALKGLLIAQSEQDKQIQNLSKKEKAIAQAQFDIIKAKIATVRQRIKEVEGTALEHEETVLEQVERGKKAKAELATALTKEVKIDEKQAAEAKKSLTKEVEAEAKKSFLQKALDSAGSAQGAAQDAFTTGAILLSNAIAPGNITTGENLNALFQDNTGLRAKAQKAFNFTPITNNTVAAPVGATPLIVPLATRNPENTLQQNRLKDHGSAVT